MNRLKGAGITGLLNTVASMLLFLVFAVCMLIIIGSAAGTYSRISKSYDTTYGSAASIRYISNKIRACDSCEIIDGGSAIAFRNGRLVSIVYQQGGGLYENNVSVDSEITTVGGDMIFEIDEMNIVEKDALYEVTVSYGNSISTVLVRKGDTTE